MRTLAEASYGDWSVGLRVAAADHTPDRERINRSRATTPPARRFKGITKGVVDGGGGRLQCVTDIPAAPAISRCCRRFSMSSRRSGLSVTFTMVFAYAGDPTRPDKEGQ
uniref:Uncharacterized protein MLCB12.15c n=1 Tax=Mycobacterium leprae TaxID=1769 RepID=Q9Z5K3_MYCLR|nr:hypothetical protein [Mycobacterium leprae]